MSVKVDPAHVEGVARSPLYALMSDWKTAVPTALLVAMPFYTSGKFPGFDERMELAMIVTTACVLLFKGALRDGPRRREAGGTGPTDAPSPPCAPALSAPGQLPCSTRPATPCSPAPPRPAPPLPPSSCQRAEAGPMFMKWQTAAIEAKNKALYAEEAAFNEEIARAIDVMHAGLSVPETVKTVNTAERALRAVEAEAATRKAAHARREAVAHALDFLVSIKASAGADSEGAALRGARAAVEAALEKDAAVQQKSIEAAIKALKEGQSAPADDVIEPIFSRGVAAAKAEAASKAAANPFTNAQNVDMFRKRFNLDLVSSGKGAVKVVKLQ